MQVLRPGLGHGSSRHFYIHELRCPKKLTDVDSLFLPMKEQKAFQRTELKKSQKVSNQDLQIIFFN